MGFNSAFKGLIYLLRFLDMLGYEGMESSTSSQETVLFKSLLDLRRPLEGGGGLYAEYNKKTDKTLDG